MKSPCVPCWPTGTDCETCEITRLTRELANAQTAAQLASDLLAERDAELARHADQKKVFACGHENVGCCVECAYRKAEALDHECSRLASELMEERAARVAAEAEARKYEAESAHLADCVESLRAEAEDMEKDRDEWKKTAEECGGLLYLEQSARAAAERRVGEITYALRECQRTLGYLHGLAESNTAGWDDADQRRYESVCSVIDAALRDGGKENPNGL